jgi:hypothetical protein
MIKNRKFSLFPLVDGDDVIIKYDHKEEHRGDDEELTGQNLKKMVRMPPPFIDYEATIKRGYCFSIPKEFV